MANIGLAICSSRFLILPSVKVRGLASQALRLAAERVAGDWEEKYGSRPALAFSSARPDHSGLSRRAAGSARERRSGLDSDLTTRGATVQVRAGEEHLRLRAAWKPCGRPVSRAESEFR